MLPSDISKNIGKLFVSVAILEEKMIILRRDIEANENNMRNWLKWCIGTIISLASLGVAIYAMVKIF